MEVTITQFRPWVSDLNLLSAQWTTLRPSILNCTHGRPPQFKTPKPLTLFTTYFSIASTLCTHPWDPCDPVTHNWHWATTQEYSQTCPIQNRNDDQWVDRHCWTHPAHTCPLAVKHWTCRKNMGDRATLSRPNFCFSFNYTSGCIFLPATKGTSNHLLYHDSFTEKVQFSC